MTAQKTPAITVGRTGTAELRAAIETITHPAIYEYQKYGDQGVEKAIDAILELINKQRRFAVEDEAKKVSAANAALRVGGLKLDNDTIRDGVNPPFNLWESDHTGLVHVLWNADYNGLTIARDADDIGSLILRSRWLAAQNQQVIDGNAPVGLPSKPAIATTCRA